MKFKNDILLIFNESNDGSDNEVNWIEQFSLHLKNFLEQILKGKCGIDAVSSSEIKNEDDLSAYAVIIPIITPGFMESKACLFALEEFIEQTKNDVKTTLKGYDRVFKVVREPFDHQLLPAMITENHRYNFFETDLLTDKLSLFKALKEDNTRDDRYWLKLNDLAYDIKKVLIQIKSFGFTGGAETAMTSRIVYLAETAEDLLNERDIIKRDLQRHGYVVLPEKALDGNDTIIKEKIKRDIERSDLAIHLIGNEYGRIPEGLDASIVELQNSISQDYSMSVLNQITGKENTMGFHRLLWINSDPQEITAKQKIYVDGLRKQAEFMDDTDILESPIEDLKNTIRQELKFNKRRLSRRYKPDEVGNTGSNKIYLIANKSKEQESKQLSQLLDKQGYKTSMTSYDGSVIEVLKNHHRQLMDCDAAIVLYTDETEFWLDAKIKDLLKSPGLGRKSPMVAKAIVSAQGAAVDNRHIDQLNAVIISTDKSLDEKTLNPFFEKFEAIK